MEIKNRQLADLIGAEYNPRKISDSQLKVLMDSMSRLGNLEPIVVNMNPERENIIISGHQRARAAAKLGMTEYPCLEVDFDLAKEKEANIRMNQNGGDWDAGVLGEMFEASDLKAWGFEDDEFSKVMESIEPEPVVEGLTDDDEVPDVPEEPKTKPGDIYILGDHRLMCGDSTSSDDVGKLMDGEKADLMIADPPYNVGYEYNSVDDKKDNQDYLDFCSSYMNNGMMFSSTAIITPGKSNEIHYKDRPDYREYMVWFKKFSLSIGSFYKAMVTEPILIFGDKPKNKHYKRDIFEIMTEREPGLRKLHTCPKPVSLWVEIIEPMTDRENIVLEMFGGSGTAVIACEKLGRKCRMMELDPAYCDVIVKRWEDFTGRTATLEGYSASDTVQP